MRRGLPALGLVPLLVLAGCSGSSEPSPSPSASPSLAAVPTATPATPEGAVAFARLYFETLRTAFLTGDTTALRGLTSPDCRTCAQQVEVIVSEAAAGTRYSGGEITAFSAESLEQAPGEYVVAVDYTAEPYQRRVGSAAPTPLQGARGVRLEVALGRQGDSWVVREVTPGGP